MRDEAGAGEGSGVASRSPAKPRVEITYCAKCRFLPRAAWMAQELLTTFPGELGEIALVPGDGGVFQVRVVGELVACRARDGGFPELAELKRRLRDRVAPGRELGHSDRP
jgi:selenoprotein W-related protein